MIDRASDESDSSSAFSDLSVMISLSLCTTIPVTTSAMASRSPKLSALVAALPWLAAILLQAFHDGVFNISGGKRETVPADAVLASPCRIGVDA